MAKFRKSDIVRVKGTDEIVGVQEVLKHDVREGILLSNDGKQLPFYKCELISPYDPEFKKGQRVRCIDDYGCSTITEGTYYEVASVDDSRKSYCGRFQRVRIADTKQSYMAARFEKANPDDEYVCGLLAEIEELKERLHEAESALETIAGISAPFA